MHIYCGQKITTMEGIMIRRSKWKPGKEEVVVQNGAVTAMQPPSAEAGLEMLKKGGNAVVERRL